MTQVQADDEQHRLRQQFGEPKPPPRVRATPRQAARRKGWIVLAAGVAIGYIGFLLAFEVQIAHPSPGPAVAAIARALLFVGLLAVLRGFWLLATPPDG
jgi:drug/metabolite transporter (DMT)-like permease